MPDKADSLLVSDQAVSTDASRTDTAASLGAADRSQPRVMSRSRSLFRHNRHAPPPKERITTLGGGWLEAVALAEGGLLADVGVILDLVSIYVPLIGAVFSPAVPTPFAILMLRRGPRVTLISAAVAAFLVTVLAGPHFGWRMGLEAIVGLLLGWAMRVRLRPLLTLALGTCLVASVTFLAALGVIFISGLPVKDIVGGLRNGMGSLAWVLATGAGLLGGETQWLAVRPALVAVGAFALRFWPLLLYLYITAYALPTVALYYAVANGSARIFEHDVRPFPPRWLMRMLRFTIALALAPVLAPRRALRWLGSRGKRHANPPLEDEEDA